MGTVTAQTLVNCWAYLFKVDNYDIKLEPISDEQVMYPDDCVGEERYFIGISKDEQSKTATIHHCRPLTEEDIIHELLHLANPDKSEEWVVRETSRYILEN